MKKNMKVYKLLGIDTAMHLLRPEAKWEISGNVFTRWEDERPCPTIEEVYETIDKIKAFEDSIDTIYTKQQLEKLGEINEVFNEALGEE
jgi:hypothetical protein